MKKYIKPFLGFLLLNFLGLALGSIYTDPGVSSEWYSNLAKAPWTPPGWVFGFAWTTIMICLSVWNAKVWVEKDTPLLKLYYLSWIYNVVWNPVFFHIKLDGGIFGNHFVSCVVDRNVNSFYKKRIRMVGFVTCPILCLVEHRNFTQRV